VEGIASLKRLVYVEIVTDENGDENEI